LTNTGSDCKAHDTRERTWRHLNFFQYKAFLKARAPRIDCKDCGIKTVEVPWSRSGSGCQLNAILRQKNKKYHYRNLQPIDFIADEFYKITGKSVFGTAIALS